MSKKTLSYAGILVALVFLLVINTNTFGIFCEIPCGDRKFCYWSEGDPADGHCFYFENRGGGFELYCIYDLEEFNCDVYQTYMCCIDDPETEECWIWGKD